MEAIIFLPIFFGAIFSFVVYCCIHEFFSEEGLLPWCGVFIWMVFCILISVSMYNSFQRDCELMIREGVVANCKEYIEKLKSAEQKDTERRAQEREKEKGEEEALRIVELKKKLGIEDSNTATKGSETSTLSDDEKK